MRIAVFIIIFIYLSVHLTYIFREPLSHTKAHLMGFYSEKKNTVDVAVIGTSCTFSAIAPMQLWEDRGIAAYDFCTNVMLENTMKYAIREVLRTQSPRLVIIDIAPFMNGHAVWQGRGAFASNTQVLRYNTDGFKISKNRLDLINDIVYDKKKRWSYYFDLAYHHSNPNPDIHDWNLNRPSPNKGYSNTPIEIIFTEKSGEDTACPDQCPLADWEMSLFDELLAETDKQGINVLFINGPYWPVDDKPDDFKKAAYLKKYLTDKGYDYLDLHEHMNEINLVGTEDYSMDYNHYTITGAVKISKFLGNYLADNYDLPDRRTDKRYDKWRAEYTEWSGKVLPDNIAWSERQRREYLDSHPDLEK